MSIDLHNHTKLCNHAQGEMEEYVETAIKRGIKISGFSDHAPMSFDEEYRMGFEQMESYENSVKQLQDIYRSKIDIKLAYEVDFLPNYIDSRVLSRDVDYLIGSVHFINEWGFDNPEFIGEYDNKDLDKLWSEYFEAIALMAKSGLFNIVGHMDLLKIFNFLPNSNIVELAYEALKEIKKSGMAVEINAAGFRKKINEQYPSKTILEEIKNLSIPITLSSDAHLPEHVGLNRDRVMELILDIGFKEVAYFKNRNMEMIKI